MRCIQGIYANWSFPASSRPHPTGTNVPCIFAHQPCRWQKACLLSIQCTSQQLCHFSPMDVHSVARQLGPQARQKLCGWSSSTKEKRDEHNLLICSDPCGKNEVTMVSKMSKGNLHTSSPTTHTQFTVILTFSMSLVLLFI